MILVHKIQYRELEPYKIDYLESLRQNISNSLISKILIFSDLDIPGLPKNNKINFSIKKGYSEVDILKYVSNIHKNETIIWANPYAIFNHTLMKVNSIGKGKIIQLSSYSNGLLNKGSIDTLIFDNIILDESKQTIYESLIGERIDVSLSIIVNNKRPSYYSKPIQTQTKNFDIIPRRNIQKESNIESQIVNLQSRRQVAKKEDIKADPGIKINKIDAVIVSVDYNDFLILTLKNNIKYLENITVVTSTSDTLCKEICDKFGVKCVITDRMYEDGAKFNKGKAINEGIKSIQNPEWILLLDADIILPNNWSEIINSNIFKKDALHICSRNIIENYDDYQRWINGEQVGKIESSKGFGYFQLFNVNSSAIFGRNPIFPETSDDASWSDLSFRNKFNNRVDINISVIHLGKAYSNWKGRETEMFINDEEINRLFNKKTTYTICSYYFNFRNDIRQKNNFIKFLDQFKDYYDKMIVGVINYGDIDFEIPCEKLIIDGDIDNKIWSKEILINKILEKVNTDYLIWIDGDLIYENLDWLNNLDSISKGYDFVQLFNKINYLGENGELLESHKSIMSANPDSKNIDYLLEKGYKPGGSWMGKVRILKEKKLFEQMYVGGGDTIFLYGLFNVKNGWTLSKVKENNYKIWKNSISWIDSLGKYTIGYLNETINHLYHGNLSDRNYNNRYKKLSKIKNRNKIAIYTCISGGYDILKEVLNVENNIDYICYTDREIESETWEIRKIPEYMNEVDQAKIARCVKTLPHIFLKEYETTVWVDGNIQVIGNINEFISNNLINYFAIAKHPDRKCIYDESNAVILLNKDKSDVVNEQMSQYMKMGYPKDNGLVQSGIIIRNNNQYSREIGELWWDQIYKYSKRDQLSFNYVIWNKEFIIDIMKPSIICSKYFQIYKHNGEIIKLRKGYDDIKNYINGKEV
jgi:hypothetical protein